MAVAQVVDVLRITRGRARRSQVGVACGAGFFAGSSNIYAPAMLGVAGSAVRSARLISVVGGAVMARETSLILYLG